MTQALLPSEVEAEARALIIARESSLGVEVTTPIAYPNGDLVTVIVAPEADGYTVHDAGLGAMFLTGEGVRIDRDMVARLIQAAKRYDCGYSSGRIARATARDGVPESLMLVANASRSIADLSIEVRRQAESDFRYVLAEKVREIAGRRVRENEVFTGKSTTPYRVANTILDKAAREPIGFVIPLPARSSVAPQFRQLFDLQAAYPSIIRLAVYNEYSDFRPDKDGWLLAQVGELAPLGRIQEVLPRILEASPPQGSLAH